MKGKSSEQGANYIFAYILAGLIGVLGIGIAYYLLYKGLIGEFTFFSLVCLFIFVALVVAFRKELEILTIKDFKIKFREIKQTESSVKSLATAILELSESIEDGYKRPCWDRARYEKAKENLKNLI